MRDLPSDHRCASAAELQSLIRKYMVMLGLEIQPKVKVSNSLGAKNLGTTKWVAPQSTTTITIQKSIMADPVTLERIVAHEMAHHAAFLDIIRGLEGIVKERGAEAGPYVRGYIRGLSRGDGHGDDWLKYVKVINAHMGSDFVTKTSDHSYVQDTETKPYFVMIALLPNDKYGYQIGVKLSPKMKQEVARWSQQYGAKLIQTTDARWQHGPRIGSLNWATSADKQDEMRRLHSQERAIMTSAERVVRRFAIEAKHRVWSRPR